MAENQIVLAYSGGLDTSVAIKWIKEKYGLDIIAVVVDVGQPDDFAKIRDKALKTGAVEAVVIDAKQEFATDFIAPALAANALYERKYPLPTALARPLIAKKLVEIARDRQAIGIGHGCTGKGNDQVRFDVAIGALAPELKIIAPAREWQMTREQEIVYAQEHGIEIPITKSSPYSIDENIYGRSIEAGALEDPWAEPPADVWSWTKGIGETPDKPTTVEIEFTGGSPTALDGNDMGLLDLIDQVNVTAGEHGIGRIDMVEDRVVGLKSREIYECPAAVLLTQAHREIESLVLPKDVIQFKYGVEDAFADQVYNGLWFSPLRRALASFTADTQAAVDGVVRLRLHKGAAAVTGRRSDNSLYDLSLATYDENDKFPHDSAAGFIELFGLAGRTWAKKHGGAN